MVKELRDQPGSAYDPLLNEFVSDVANDQAVEIERMNELLVGLSSDPRAGLAPGLFDAEEAILNLELVVSQRKPPGFYDPNNPAARGAAALEKSQRKNQMKRTSPSQPRSQPMLYAILCLAFLILTWRLVVIFSLLEATMVLTCINFKTLASRT